MAKISGREIGRKCGVYVIGGGLNRGGWQGSIAITALDK